MCGDETRLIRRQILAMRDVFVYVFRVCPFFENITTKKTVNDIILYTLVHIARIAFI